MYRVNGRGEVVREAVGLGSHEHHVLNGVSNPRDFHNLTNEAQVSALLLPDIVASALAPSTANSYARQWNKFVGWCDRNNRTCLPASPDTCKLYLTNVGLRSWTLPPVLAARSALRYYITLYYPNLTPPPTDSPAVEIVMTGLKRKYARVITKKKPVTPDLVKQCMLKLVYKPLHFLNLVELRNAALFSVLYSVAARFE